VVKIEIDPMMILNILGTIFAIGFVILLGWTGIKLMEGD